MEYDLRLLPDDFEDCLTTSYDLILRSPFRLLDLPPELWIRVCELAVIKPKGIVLGRESDFANMARITAQPNITRTCKLLRTEALSIFYSLNKWEFVHNVNVPCPRHFLTAIGHMNLKRIGAVIIHSNCDKDFWVNTCQRGHISCDVELIGINTNSTDWWRGVYTFRVKFT